MRWRHPYETHPSLLALALVAALGGCAIGPDYQRPDLAVPAEFKEAEGWRRAEPRDVFQRGAWWELYGDQTLNDLQMHLERSNQTLAQSVAQFRQAEALVRGARAAFFRRSPATRARPAAARAAAIAPCCCREARR